MSIPPLYRLLPLALAAVAGGIGTLLLWPSAPPAEPAAPAASTSAWPAPYPTVNPSTGRAATQTAGRAADGSAAANLAAALSEDSEFARQLALYALAADADAQTLPDLIEATATLPAQDQHTALAVLFARFADLDPLAALRYLSDSGIGSRDHAELQVVFRAWARRDLAAALNAAGTLDRRRREAAGLAILEARDDLSSLAADDIADRLGVEALLGELRLDRTLALLDRDPAAAWQAVLAADSGRERQQHLAEVARAWAGQDPHAALNAVASLGDAGLRSELQAEILSAWADLDPNAAVDWALLQPPSRERARQIAVALGALAELAPGQAFDIATSLPDERQVVGYILRRWAQSDVRAAASALTSVTDRRARRYALSSIAARYAEADLDGSLQWVDTLEGGEARQATGAVFRQLAQQDVRDAARLIDTLASDDQRDWAASTVAASWTDQDPTGAARWAETLSDPAVRQRALTTLTGRWSRYDRDAAVRYARSLPVRTDREAAMVAIIRSRGQDMAVSEELFRALTLPEQRARAAQTLYRRVRSSDPERAARYARIAGIDEASGFGG